jgi:hypothetical protein
VEILLGQQAPSDGGSFGLTVFALLAMLAGFAALGYVCLIFWRAKKRDEAESERGDRWPNARSS